MKESVIYPTENGNLYVYDVRHKFSMLIHPKLSKISEKSAETDPYYLKKYNYLKGQCFLGQAEPSDFETVLDETTIQEKIIQTQQLVFEATDHCNLNCTYCALGELYESGKKGRKKNINIHYAVNLLKYIFDLKRKNKDRTGKFQISFFGGEPLVNMPFIKQIVEIANQLNAEVALELGYYMTTNATLIHKYINFLVEYNFRLLISFDGDEEGQSYRTYAKNNKNSFWQVIENIDMIQRDFPAYFADNVKFNAVLHNRNSVKSIYDFVYKRYNKIPEIAQLNTGDINPDKKELFEHMFLDKRKSEEECQHGGSNSVPGSRISYTELNYFLRNYSINFYVLDLRYLLYDPIKLYPTGTCMPFSKKIFLNTHHNLLPCERVHFEYSLGKVNENVIIDIPEIARKYNVYFNRFKKVCQNCYIAESCDICMLKLGNLDQLDTEELVCPGFQDQEAFKKEQKHMFSLLEKEANEIFK